LSRRRLLCLIWSRKLVFLAAVIVPLAGSAQSWTPESPTSLYPPRRTIGIFGDYSPSSSHIILGETRKREFYSLGAAFTQRLAVRRGFTLFYLVEARPFTLWSDPILKSVTTVYTSPSNSTLSAFLRQSPPVINTYPHTLPFQFVDPKTGIFYQGVNYIGYGRRYLYAGNFSPIGFKLNLRPQARFQPVFSTTGGFQASFRDLPMFDSSAFNFTFSFGGGVEWYQTETRSLRLEYRVQHLSNAYIGTTNPGTDSQVIRATWSWGRR